MKKTTKIFGLVSIALALTMFGCKQDAGAPSANSVADDVISEATTEVKSGDLKDVKFEGTWEVTDIINAVSTEGTMTDSTMCTVLVEKVDGGYKVSYKKGTEYKEATSGKAPGEEITDEMKAAFEAKAAEEEKLLKEKYDDVSVSYDIGSNSFTANVSYTFKENEVIPGMEKVDLAVWFESQKFKSNADKTAFALTSRLPETGDEYIETKTTYKKVE